MHGTITTEVQAPTLADSKVQRLSFFVFGDADKNLDWLCREAQALTILNGTESAEGNLDSFLVVPTNL